MVKTAGFHRWQIHASLTLGTPPRFNMSVGATFFILPHRFRALCCFATAAAAPWACAVVCGEVLGHEAVMSGEQGFAVGWLGGMWNGRHAPAAD